jgi:sterol desaturase/sphingolipid hydroxylase (fatty acid hydroxylase superfamily)
LLIKNGVSMRRNISTVLILVFMVFLSSCAKQPPVNAYDPPGFFSGLIHGFLIFFEFLAGIFTDTRIYAFPNSGWWYDFGYFIGVTTFIGSTTNTR